MGETKAPATVSRYVVSLSKGFQAAGLPNLAKEEPVKLALKVYAEPKERARDKLHHLM